MRSATRQQRLVQVGPHPFRSIPRRVVLEPAATQRADAHDLRPSLVKATGEVAEGGQEGGLVAVLAERGVLVPPGRLQDPPGNPALLDPLPAVVRPAARGWHPVVRLLDGLPPPLLQVNTEREFLGHPLSIKEGIAGLDRGSFSLPVDQDDTDGVPRQAVRLEERTQISLTTLAPIMHDDPPRANLDQVQPASPGDKPDDALVVRRRQFPQARRGSLQDRLLCICQRPGHGIVHGPGFPGGRVQKPERPGVSASTQAPGQEERCDCGNSGLEKGASAWLDGHAIRLAVQGLQVEGGTEPPSSSQPDGCRFFDHRAAGQPVGGPRRGSSLGPSG